MATTKAKPPVGGLSKFERSITNGDAALAERGSLVARAARIEQENLVRTLEGEINKSKLDLFKLCDISPENTQDTKPRGLAADNPAQWVKDVHALKVKITIKEEELEIAKGTLKEWFDEISGS